MAKASRRREHITHAQLLEILQQLDHAQPVGIVTRTEPKMRKTGNDYFGRITKITEANVFTNCDWERRVRKAQEREGKDTTFQAGARAVEMERLRTVDGKNSPLLRKELKSGAIGFYFEVHFYGHMKCETRYLVDGRTDIAKGEFEDFLYQRNYDREAASQGVSRENVQTIRSYSTRNIIELRYAGIDYVVMH